MQCSIFLTRIGQYFKNIQYPHLLKTNEFICINISFFLSFFLKILLSYLYPVVWKVPIWRFWSLAILILVLLYIFENTMLQIEHDPTSINMDDRVCSIFLMTIVYNPHHFFLPVLTYQNDICRNLHLFCDFGTELTVNMYTK